MREFGSRNLASVWNELPHIRYGDTAQRSHHRYFKENVGLVLPAVASTGPPNHQAAGYYAQGDAVHDGGNWIPSLALRQLVGPTERKCGEKSKKGPGLRDCKSGAPKGIRAMDVPDQGGCYSCGGDVIKLKNGNCDLYE
jgi:hypothetical protein